MSRYRLIHGRSEVELAKLPDNSVDAIVTDGPYELGFMGKSWDKTGIVFNPALWAECLRVLKPGGHLLSFGGSRTYHRMACAVEDGGFQIRDMIPWMFGQGFPKSHNLSDERNGWGTALKPAQEPICLARKPLQKGLSIAANVQKWGTGALNIDGCRIPGEAWTWGTQTDIKGGGYGSNRPSEGKILAENVESDPLGRWPANVILDAEAAQMLDEQTGELTSGIPSGIRKATNNIYNQYAQGQPVTGYGDTGGASRFFYVAKASKRDREEGLEVFEKRQGGMVSNTSGQHITRRDVGYEVSPRANSHPTVKPTKLMRYLCRLITPPGGTVLDPFMGSGSTGKGAIIEGFSFIGIDQETAYVEISDARIAYALKVRKRYENTAKQIKMI